jgi:hypothetical protein
LVAVLIILLVGSTVFFWRFPPVVYEAPSLTAHMGKTEVSVIRVVRGRISGGNVTTVTDRDLIIVTVRIKGVDNLRWSSWAAELNGRRVLDTAGIHKVEDGVTLPTTHDGVTEVCFAFDDSPALTGAFDFHLDATRVGRWRWLHFRFPAPAQPKGDDFY